jgi:hypothetical protein
MRAGLIAPLIGVALVALASLPALAASRLELRALAAHVVILPEARNDIAVRMLRSNHALPVRVNRAGQVTIITGNLAHRVHGCPMLAGGVGVRVRGLGNIEAFELPHLLIRTPLDVRIIAGDAVSGVVGRSASVEVENRGCGAWTIANTHGRARVSQIGSGQERAGDSAEADLSVAGGGLITTRRVRGLTTIVSSGDGEIQVESVDGDVIARIAGSGGVDVRGGRAPHINVSVAGSGSMRFGGAAGAVTASVAGPGYVSIAHASGPVSRRVFGAGEIQVGR